jgi:hypothetical protein
MQDPYIAIDVSTDLRSHARALRRSWERGLGGGDGGVRPIIAASWRRTERAGIDPEHPDPRPGFAPDALEDHRDASGLRACVEILRSCLGGFAHDAEHVMVVVDAACDILWVEGADPTRRRADRIRFVEGMSWTEESVGTNAIGTALAIDHAVQVFSAEHYSAKQHPWWCSAAPIHDPASGAVLGVVDLSGPMHTAHPHSLALVKMAATMAEELLRTRCLLDDERLRRAYVEHTLRSRRRALALVAADGRVLHRDPAGAVTAIERVELPRGGGMVALGDGTVAAAEPFADGRGFVLWDPGRTAAATARPPALRLELLAAGGPRLRVGGADPRPLSLRHAEVLAILALHPEGLSAEELTRRLYGRAGKEVSTRAQLSRLRKLLPGVVGTRPYRLAGAVSADLLDVRAALERGDAGAALRAYHRPLLPDSGAPRIEQARRELEGALRRAALKGPLADLWAWLGTGSGAGDEDALARFVRRAGRGDARRDLAAARLRSLQSLS